MTTDPKPPGHTAWDAYWALNAASSQHARGGCLPDAAPGIERVQAQAWSAFAVKLPKSAKVLDLATGDGWVMARLLQARRDLKPVGIDQATTLPPPPRGTKIRGGVPMHALPFADGAFSAVTSQFGFEYGQIAETAAETVRVLRAGGLAGLITHRIDGPILNHNLRRREETDWAIRSQDLPGIAKRSLQLRQLGIATIPQEIAAAPEHGMREYGMNSAAWEIAEAIRRTLVLGQSDPPSRTAAIIDQIAAKAKNELARIASLEAAAMAAGSGERVAEALTNAGLHPFSSEALYDQNPAAGGAPFATYLVFQKPI